MERRGLTNQEAKREYIRLVETFSPDFRASNEKNLKEGDEESIFMTDEEYDKKKQEVST